MGSRQLHGVTGGGHVSERHVNGGNHNSRAQPGACKEALVDGCFVV